MGLIPSNYMQLDYYLHFWIACINHVAMLLLLGNQKRQGGVKALQDKLQNDAEFLKLRNYEVK